MPTPGPRTSAATRRRVERSAGRPVDRRHPADGDQPAWYRALSAEDRSWVGLVAQAGIGAFLAWYRDPAGSPHITADVFGTAPRELTRSITLRQTLDLVRTVVDVVEDEVDAPGRARRGAGPARGGPALLARGRLRRRPGLRPGRRGPRRLGRPARGAGRRRRAARRGRRRPAVAGGGARLGHASDHVVVVAGSAPQRQLGRGRGRAAAGCRTAAGGGAGRRAGAAGWSSSSAAWRTPAARPQALAVHFGDGPVVVGPDRPAPVRRRPVRPGRAGRPGGRAGRGRTPRVRCWPTTCCPSGCSAGDDARPPAAGRPGLPPAGGRAAGRCSRRSSAYLDDGGGARGLRPASCSSTRTPCATGCGRRDRDRLRPDAAPGGLRRADRARPGPSRPSRRARLATSTRPAARPRRRPPAATPPSCRNPPNPARKVGAGRQTSHGAQRRGWRGARHRLPWTGLPDPRLPHALARAARRRATGWAGCPPSPGSTWSRTAPISDADTIRDTAVAQPLIVAAGLVCAARPVRRSRPRPLRQTSARGRALASVRSPPPPSPAC